MSVSDIIFSHRIDAQSVTGCSDTVALPFEARQKARQRITLASGRSAGLKLPRGTVLRSGDHLQSECGTCIRIDAAPESVSSVASSDLQTLARAAYHLGNRHVWLQIGDGWLRYLHDHVLDAMVRGLGLDVQHDTLPFEPEAGAYANEAGAHHHH